MHCCRLSKTLAFAVVAALLAFPAAAPAEEHEGDAASQLKVKTMHDMAFLTDAKGRAVYLLESDPKSESTCYDECAEAWPPLIVAEGEAKAGSDELQTNLIGAIERTDGAKQVTYNGKPLYYFARDREPGQVTGHGVHDEWGGWYLMTPEGKAMAVPEGSGPKKEGSKSKTEGN